MGENTVHPLYGEDKNLSSKSTISILSMPIAPGLHHKKPPTQLDWRLDSIKTSCYTEFLHEVFTQLEKKLILLIGS